MSGDEKKAPALPVFSLHVELPYTIWLSLSCISLANSLASYLLIDRLTRLSDPLPFNLRLEIVPGT
jgi:hypothetical protein